VVRLPYVFNDTNRCYLLDAKSSIASNVRYAKAPGGQARASVALPDPTECTMCHTSNRQVRAGVNTLQMTRPTTTASWCNQLATLDHRRVHEAVAP